VYRPSPPPFTSRLVGPRIVDIHLEFDSESLKDVVSTYRARRQPNPILSNIPKLLGQLATPGFKAAGSGVVGLAAGEAPKEPPKTFVVTVYELELGKIDRADLSMTDTPTLVALRQTAADRADKIAKDAERRANLPGATTEDKEKAAAATATAASAKQDLDEAKRSALAALTSAYSLAPLTLIDFSAGTGVILKTGLNTPVKVENGKLVEDTGQTGVLTSLNLNFHVPYDDSWAEPTPAECWRVFVGPVLTPDVGIAAGLGWGLPFLRGVGIEAGYGVLLASVLRNGDKLGEPPTNSKRTSYRGAMGVAFVGLTFTP
jgi:hypothetical protein